MRSVKFLILPFVVLSLACSSSSGGTATPPPPPPPSGNNVHVQNDYFTPGQLTTTAGSTVTWTWYSNGVSHHLQFEDGPSDAVRNSGSYQRTFTTSGTVRYRCLIHSTDYTSGMVGSVVLH